MYHTYCVYVDTKNIAIKTSQLQVTSPRAEWFIMCDVSTIYKFYYKE